MAAAIVLGIIFGLGVYLFISLVLFKVCEKFGVGSLFECCLPIYNTVLLCQCADISGWNVLWLILPGLFLIGPLVYVGMIISIIFSVVVWGRIAERLGRSFWQYGLGTAFLFGIPALVLAFGSARFQGESGGPRPVRRDDWVTPEPLYTPLPAYDPVRPALPGEASGVSIYCCSGEMRGNSLPVPAEGITIGRDPAQCQLVLNSNEISRTHARVIPAFGKALQVSDLGSTNSTYHQVPDASSQGWRWERISGTMTLGAGKKFRVGKSAAEFEVR